LARHSRGNFAEHDDDLEKRRKTKGKHLDYRADARGLDRLRGSGIAAMRLLAASRAAAE
jgi:hypothetical protein